MELDALIFLVQEGKYGTHRLWKEKEVYDCRGEICGNEERIVSAVTGQCLVLCSLFDESTYRQLTSARAIGVICERTIATMALVNTANARPLDRRKKGNNSDGTTQIMALKKMAYDIE